VLFQDKRFFLPGERRFYARINFKLVIFSGMNAFSWAKKPCSHAHRPSLGHQHSFLCPRRKKCLANSYLLGYHSREAPYAHEIGISCRQRKSGVLVPAAAERVGTRVVYFYTSEARVKISKEGSKPSQQRAPKRHCLPLKVRTMLYSTAGNEKE